MSNINIRRDVKSYLLNSFEVEGESNRDIALALHIPQPSVRRATGELLKAGEIFLAFDGVGSVASHFTAAPIS